MQTAFPALAGAATLALVLGGCGPPSSAVDQSANSQPTGMLTGNLDPGVGASAVPSVGLPNACPADGCRATIVSAGRAPGGEITLALTANFSPDVSHNHFHIYWDRFTAQQVSADAQPRFGVTQGDWVPTADNPYTTADATSVTKRGSSSKICVTAGDRNHDVLDPTLFSCYDVSSLSGAPAAHRDATAAAAPTAAGLPNSCPAEGCRATIISVGRAANGELALTVTANFLLDLTGNHLHVYWDHFNAEQVSMDAQRRFGVTVGRWEATADKRYTTAGATSTSERGNSSKICVTAGDHDHDILDPTLFSCYDVSSLL